MWNDSKLFLVTAATSNGHDEHLTSIKDGVYSLFLLRPSNRIGRHVGRYVYYIVGSICIQCIVTSLISIACQQARHIGCHLSITRCTLWSSVSYLS